MQYTVIRDEGKCLVTPNSNSSVPWRQRNHRHGCYLRSSKTAPSNWMSSHAYCLHLCVIVRQVPTFTYLTIYVQTNCFWKAPLVSLQGLLVIKLIANRWAWGRCHGISGAARDASRACRYQWQPWEWQPSLHRHTDESVEILTNPITYLSRNRKGWEWEQKSTKLAWERKAKRTKT